MLDESSSRFVVRREIKCGFYCCFSEFFEIRHFKFKAWYKNKSHICCYMFWYFTRRPSTNPLPLQGRGFHGGCLVQYHGKYATFMWFCLYTLQRYQLNQILQTCHSDTAVTSQTCHNSPYAATSAWLHHLINPMLLKSKTIIHFNLIKESIYDHFLPNLHNWPVESAPPQEWIKPTNLIGGLVVSCHIISTKDALHFTKWYKMRLYMMSFQTNSLVVQITAQLMVSETYQLPSTTTAPPRISDMEETFNCVTCYPQNIGARLTKGLLSKLPVIMALLTPVTCYRYHINIIMILIMTKLKSTHCGLVISYGHISLRQNWLG